jgi:hypothetical protein
MGRSQDGRWDRQCKRAACGQVFTAHRAKQVYCSRTCSDEDRGNWAKPVGGTHAVAGLEMRVCPAPGCPLEGKSFQPTRRNQLACCRKCRDRLPEQQVKIREYDRSPERRMRANELRRPSSPVHNEKRVEAKRISNRKVLLARYGLTPEEFDAKLEAQGGMCAVCGKPPKPDGIRAASQLHQDHDHLTGLNRDLLCSTCNYGLGQFKDDPALLRAAADYIDRHRARMLITST